MLLVAAKERRRSNVSGNKDDVAVLVVGMIIPL